MVYYPGRWKVTCDYCGFVYYNTECVKNWQNFIVCSGCYDGPRSPLDFPPPVIPNPQVVPDPRPPNPQYVVFLLLLEDGGFLLTEDDYRLECYWPGSL